MPSFPILRTSLLATALIALTPFAHAANIKDVGASERVNFSGKLRMLSQRIAAAACNFEDGIEAETSAKILQGGVAEFDKIVNGLEFGDADLNINGEEERRKTLVAIEALRTAWAPIKTSAQGLTKVDHDASAYEAIAAGNMPLLGKAKLLVSELSGQYSDPTAMLQADAMLVDISGRQRMLTQKMSKEACQIWHLGGDAAIQEALAGTMNMFEVSLLALRDGMDMAGIKKAPTEPIYGGLDDIHSDWLEVKPMLETAVVAKPMDPAGRAEVFGRLNVMLKEMNAVVGLYTKFAKTGL